MHAIRIHRYGNADQMALETVTRPKPGKGQVLVRVHDAGVNPVDWKVREGHMQTARPISFPFTMGQDFSGEVVEADAEATGFAPGDSVLGFARGSYAEYALASAEGIAHKPHSVDFVAAASIPTAGLTAWQIVMDVASVGHGQTVLIHGAGGGVGSFAAQFAHMKQAHVIATASPEDFSYLRKLGVETLIDYKAERFEDKVKNVDVVIDLIGGETLARSYNVVKKGGLVVTTVGPVDEAEGRRRGIRVVQFVMKPDASELQQISQLVSRGSVKPRVSRVLSLDRAREAAELSEHGHPHGKVVLQIV